MKLIAKSLVAAALAGSAFVAAPAAAQVNGIATASPEAVIVRSQARINAYQQIDQTYAAQITQARTLRQEMQTLQQSLDANKDNQLTEQEVAANPGVVQQVQQKEQQLAQLSQPIVLAQTYAIEQLINDYNNARQVVLQAKNIQILLNPDAIQYAPDNINVTTDILNALNQRMPSVQTAPPAGWQPRRDSYQTQQAVQQILLGVAQQQAAQAAQQQPPAQPSGR